MTSSVSLLSSLNKVMKESISFVCHVYHIKEAEEREVEYYLLLGRHSMIFLRKDIKDVRAEIKYAHIEKIILDMIDSTIIQFTFTKTRPP